MTPTSGRWEAGEWVCDLHELALAWARSFSQPHERTPAYVDLHFAYCLAPLGRSEDALARVERARSALAGLAGAHAWLLGAFAYRVRQALDGKPTTGPLPAEMAEPLEEMERLERYVVDRLRKHSRILEPDQRINPYRHWGARISEFEKAVAELADATDRDEIVSRVEKLLRKTRTGERWNEERARALRAGLDASPRVGEDFARKLLEQSIPAYDALPEAKEMAPLMEQAQFLEKALFVAGHFGLTEFIR